MDTEFNIGDIEYDCAIYGPGKRTVIWFQGCTLGCKGCWNTQFQSPEPNRMVDREELLWTIIDHKNDVTFLGGEPLQQSENLSWLVHRLRDLGIGFMLYTGYEMDEIARNAEWSEICDAADILIPGRYVETLRDTDLRWRGSSNQRILFKHGPEEVEEKNEVEIVISPDGSVACMGYPNKSIRDYVVSMDYADDPRGSGTDRSGRPS